MADIVVREDDKALSSPTSVRADILPPPQFDGCHAHLPRQRSVEGSDDSQIVVRGESDPAPLAAADERRCPTRDKVLSERDNGFSCEKCLALWTPSQFDLFHHGESASESDLDSEHSGIWYNGEISSEAWYVHQQS